MPERRKMDNKVLIEALLWYAIELNGWHAKRALEAAGIDWEKVEKK